MSLSDESVPRPGEFAPTRWTLVLRARGQSPAAQSALAELCDSYYAPVLAFIRQAVRDEEAARDLTQEFFARLLGRHGLDTVEPGRGRFRSFLLGAVKHFLAHERERNRAAKRGGGETLVSLEGAAGPGGTTVELPILGPPGPPPDAFFDRQWALRVVERAVEALAAEFASAGKDDHFNALKPWLIGELQSVSQAEAARQLGLTEGAVKVAIHRLRRRFRDLVKAEIAHTLGEPGQVQEELRYLLEVLSQAG